MSLQPQARRPGPSWSQFNDWPSNVIGPPRMRFVQSYADLPELGLLVTIERKSTALSPSAVADLRDWLEWWLGGHPGQPPDPDVLRGAIYAELAALRVLADDLVDDPRAVTGLTHGIAALNRLLATVEAARDDRRAVQEPCGGTNRPALVSGELHAGDSSAQSAPPTCTQTPGGNQ